MTRVFILKLIVDWRSKNLLSLSQRESARTILRVARASRVLTPVRLGPMTSRHRGLFVPLA
ncbi:MAG: hypothetical protein DME32_05355, partial [Verrucomicrobia bacterium]